jgi:hypothetical protein
MTPEEFNKFWTLTYPATPPIQYLFRHNYADKWFRIHSLPQSKRYANSKQEWDILLARHNEIITDIIGDDEKVLLVTGDYNFNAPLEIHITHQDPIFKSFSFTRANDIDLYELSRDEYGQGEVYRPAFAEIRWRPRQYDVLLKAIADDELQAFFVSPASKRIAAPYDGGIDFILNDTKTRDIFKEKYNEWLSERQDGM